MPIDGLNDSTRDEIHSLATSRPQQWKSGIAAWLGWLFDGLDMHLYVLVAAPFVAELVGVTDTRNEVVGWYSSLIQAAFLVGWALGGGFFGRVGDLIGRSRALCLTILTYALFTGLALFRANMVATAHRTVPGGPWHRRRVGRRGVVAVGDVASPLAAVDRCGTPERRQHRRLARFVRYLRAGGPEPPCGLPGRRASGPTRILDPPGSPRDRRMVHSQARGEGRRARHCRPFPRRSTSHGHSRHPGLLGQPDGTLGVHVLVSATLAKPARRDQSCPPPARTKLPASPTSW